MEVSVATWSSILRRSRIFQLPPWIALPAATALGLGRLAANIATLPASAPSDFTQMPDQSKYNEWIRIVQRSRDSRKAILVIAADGQSPLCSWLVSATSPVLFTTQAEFVELVLLFAGVDISSPQEVGIERLFFELTGDSAQLNWRLRNAPSSNMSPPDLTPLGRALLNLPCGYIVPERPPETIEKLPYSWRVAPGSVDALFAKPAVFTAG